MGLSSILSTEADISEGGLFRQVSGEDVLMVSLGDAIVSALPLTVGGRMCGIYTWSQIHSGVSLSDLHSIVEQEEQETES